MIFVEQMSSLKQMSGSKKNREDCEHNEQERPKKGARMVPGKSNVTKTGVQFSVSVQS